MKTYEVTLIEKEWYTVEVQARSPEEAKRIVRAAIIIDEPPLDDLPEDVLDANPCLDDFWSEARDQGYTEAEIESVEEV